ncbi:hypothetical protein H4R33_004591 [Dimargaris cristalligena]|nr:hypothetical protein H4R33_004591 [Dimargaris cristalligena]
MGPSPPPPKNKRRRHRERRPEVSSECLTSPTLPTPNEGPPFRTQATKVDTGHSLQIPSEVTTRRKRDGGRAKQLLGSQDRTGQPNASATPSTSVSASTSTCRPPTSHPNRRGKIPATGAVTATPRRPCLDHRTSTSSSNDPSPSASIRISPAATPPPSNMPILPGFTYCPVQRRYFKVEKGGASNPGSQHHEDQIRERQRTQELQQHHISEQQAVERAQQTWPEFLANRDLGCCRRDRWRAYKEEAVNRGGGGGSSRSPSRPTQLQHVEMTVRTLKPRMILDLAQPGGDRRDHNGNSSHVPPRIPYDLATGSIVDMLVGPAQDQAISLLTTQGQLDTLTLTPTTAFTRRRTLAKAPPLRQIQADLLDTHQFTHGTTMVRRNHGHYFALFPGARNQPPELQMVRQARAGESCPLILQRGVKWTTAWTMAVGSHDVSLGTSDGIYNFNMYEATRPTDEPLSIESPARTGLGLGLRMSEDPPTGIQASLNLVIQTGSDVFAIQRDRYHPSLVYAGCRDGRARLFDYRVPFSRHLPQYGLLPGVHMPGTSITHLDQTNEWQLLTATTGDSHALWDIRYMRGTAINASAEADAVVYPVVPYRSQGSDPVIQVDMDYRRTNPLARSSRSGEGGYGGTPYQPARSRKAGTRTTTTMKTALVPHTSPASARDPAHPVLYFKGHVNQNFSRDLGLALHPGGSVLAAAGSDRCIRLWSTTTGQLLNVLTSPFDYSDMASKAEVDPYRIRTIQWYERADWGTSPFALLVAQHRGLALFDTQ